MEIEIKIGGIELKADLLDNETARAVYEILPLELLPNVWGDEFYSEIPLYMPEDDSATTDVEVGDIGYWPRGKALAIFFGPTPLSGKGDKETKKPVPAGPVNLIGKIRGDASVLRKTKGAATLLVTKSEKKESASRV